MRTWTGEEAAQFLAATMGHPDAAPNCLALATRMRQGDVLGLRWRDLEVETSSISVRHQIVRAGGMSRPGPPKTAASRRRIVLDSATIATLRSHRRSPAAERLQTGRGQSADDLVFSRLNRALGTPTWSATPSGSRRWPPGCLAFGFTISGTRTHLFSWRAEQTPRSCRSGLATGEWRSRWTSTATSFPTCRLKQRFQLGPHCGPAGDCEHSVSRLLVERPQAGQVAPRNVAPEHGFEP